MRAPSSAKEADTPVWPLTSDIQQGRHRNDECRYRRAQKIARRKRNDRPWWLHHCGPNGDANQDSQATKRCGRKGCQDLSIDNGCDDNDLMQLMACEENFAK